MFKQSLETIFAEYPLHVVEYITSPLTGIQRMHKFPPQISEVVEALDGRMAYLAKREEAIRTGRYGSYTREPKKLDERPYVKPEHPPGHFAQVAVSPEAPQYEAMVARSEEEDRSLWRFEQRVGKAFICVPLAWMERETAKKVDDWTPLTPEQLTAYYATVGAGHLRTNMFSGTRPQHTERRDT